MKTETSLRLAKALVSPSMLFVWNKETKGKDVTIETAKLVKDCYFGGDNAPYKEWARLTIEIMEACKVLNDAGLEGEYGEFYWA
jgi:hypothetical protein